MSTKTKLIFQSVLIILKNATIIIPILEGIVEAIYNVKHPETEEKKDETRQKNPVDPDGYNYRDDEH